MKVLVFATNNVHKLKEVRAILGISYKILSLEDIGCTDDIPETADTLEGNAMLKAKYIYEKYGVNCFADDTGLEVEVLNGAPGVYSARYAGPGHNSCNNMKKLLTDMSDKANRSACFRTIIALIVEGESFLFEGKVDGSIATEPLGEAGFGYDPVFIPLGYGVSFAQLSEEEKNTISHRAKALEKMACYVMSSNRV